MLNLGTIAPFSFVSKLKVNLYPTYPLLSPVSGIFIFLSFSEFEVGGSLKLFNSVCSFADSHEVLLSPVKCGVAFNISSSIISVSSFLFKEKNLPFSLFLFFSMNIKGEFDGVGVFCESLLPLVEGSISSFELSGIINLRLGFFIWQLSILSSTGSSFISLMSLTFEGSILIVWAGLSNLGWTFGAVLDESSSVFSCSAKKSFGKIFLFIVFNVELLYFNKYMDINIDYDNYFWL